MELLFIMYLLLLLLYTLTVYLNSLSVFVGVEDIVLALGAKSRYFPPASSGISNLLSRADNPQTG